jgi:hypothetical protein
VTLGEAVADELMMQARDHALPMFRVMAEEYQLRMPEGYPVVIDEPDRSGIGFELDPNYSLYILSDGEQLYADLYYREPRNDALSSASREKFSGQPFHDRRPLGTSVTDQEIRNLIAELVSRWNFQPMLLYITDTD